MRHKREWDELFKGAKNTDGSEGRGQKKGFNKESEQNNNSGTTHEEFHNNFCYFRSPRNCFLEMDLPVLEEIQNGHLLATLCHQGGHPSTHSRAICSAGKKKMEDGEMCAEPRTSLPFPPPPSSSPLSPTSKSPPPPRKNTAAKN